MLVALPRDNVNIRPHLEELNALADALAWNQLDQAVVEHLRVTIAPLLRFLSNVNMPVMTFEARTEQLAVAYLTGNTGEAQKIRGQILRDLALLSTNLPEVQTQVAKLAWVCSSGFWE